LIGGADTEPDAHLREQIFQAKSRRRLLHPPVQIPDFAHWSKLTRQAGEFSGAHQHFRLRGIGMQMVGWHSIRIAHPHCCNMKCKLTADEMQMGKLESNQR
jgi:hypothetical protein